MEQQNRTIAPSLTFLKARPGPALIAMVHVGALPGTPRHQQSVRAVEKQAVAEAKLLAEAGVDAILLENMHDVPYLNRAVGPEITASMTAVCKSVRQAVTLPLGVQVLAGANREALAVAQAAGLQFVRCEGFVFAHVADEGLMAEADAGPLLRYRRMIGAEEVAILADIKKKHSSHAITADVELAETARAAAFFGADGVVVTGTATGQAAGTADVRAAREAVNVALLVGSGVTPDNIAAYAKDVNGVIVGSALKAEGRWENPPERARVTRMVEAVRNLSGM
jgi:membrane complex biogenesis BtpA family protein